VIVVTAPAVLGRTLQFTTVNAKAGLELPSCVPVTGGGLHFASKKSNTRLIRPVSNK
jgi:hypothetical protein